MLTHLFLAALFLAAAGPSRPITVDSGLGFSAVLDGADWIFLKSRKPRTGPKDLGFQVAWTVAFVNERTQAWVRFHRAYSDRSPLELERHCRELVPDDLEMAELDLGPGVRAFGVLSPLEKEGEAEVLLVAFARVEPLVAGGPGTTVALFGRWLVAHHQESLADMKRFSQSLRHVSPSPKPAPPGKKKGKKR